MFPLSHNYFQVVTNTAKHETATPPRPFSGRRYALGLFVLLLVDILWVASSEITKLLYTDKKYDKPFFITYVRTTLLSVYLFALCVASPPSRSPSVDYTQLFEQAPETEDENFYSEPNDNLGDSTFVPVRAAGETTDSDDAAPRSVRFNKVAEVRVMSAAQAGEALLARLSWQASRRACEQARRRVAADQTRSHLKLALMACVPWFMANYLYRLSLLSAPSSAASLYSSSYSVFALALAALFSQSPTDRFNLAKLTAATLTALGLIMVGAWQAHSEHRLMSAAAAVGAGLSYTLHLLVLRHEFKRKDSASSPVFFGLVGGLCFALAWLVGGALHAAGAERLEWPAAALWGWLLLDAAAGALLAEPLWLWGRSLTSPLAATTSLFLAVPLALCAEGWRGAGAGAGWAGAALAGAGWAAAAALAGGGVLVGGWLRESWWPGESLSSLRYIPGLDEQTESLISSEEST